jgi:hypothetical protein
VNHIDAILIGLAYGAERRAVRAQVAELLASQSAFCRGVGNELVRVPGPRCRRASC